MHDYRLTRAMIGAFRQHLVLEERSGGTVEKYIRDIQEFYVWTEGKPVSREMVLGWKEALLAKGLAPVTVNSKIAALNTLFRVLGWTDCRAKYLRIQRRLFRDSSKVLTQVEYNRLISAARTLGRERLELLMETICATGIRVSEVQYITAEAALAGKAEVSLKGKIRTILLPGKLCRKLQKYAKKQKITSGEIFLTRSGRGLSRKQIWSEMKAICKTAGVEYSKVFPHNLRHLFARAFHKVSRDVAKLADVLGHSSIETTRIYLISTGAEHTKQLERLGFVT